MNEGTFSRTLKLCFTPKKKILYLMAIVPLFDFDAKKLLPAKRFNYQCYILMTLFTIGNSWAVAVTNIYNVLYKSDIFERIFINIAELEDHKCNGDVKKLSKREKILKRNVKISYYILNLNIFYIFSLNCYCLGKFNMWREYFTIWFIQQELIFYCYISMFIYVCCYFLKSCSIKFYELNQIIKSIKYSTVYDEVLLSQKILYVEMIYRKLNKTVKLIEKLYGFQFILMMMLCSTLLLQLCCFIKRIWPVYTGIFVNPVTKFHVSIAAFIQTAIVLFYCDEVINQSNKIMITCYDVQDCITIYSKPYLQLQRFTKKLPDMKIKITALNLFDLNRSKIFPILGSVATYFIVVEQFWN